MRTKKPIYNNFSAPSVTEDIKKSRGARIKIVHCLDDLMKVFSIRSAVFISEQECPFAEEFEGNDFCAIHFIGFVDNEPAGCIRVRFFADFAKIERLAVRHEYRDASLSYRLVKAAIEFSRKKGYLKIYGHAQERLVKFWARFGAKPLPNRRSLVFSDFSYKEMLLIAEPHNNPIDLNSDPYVIIRNEGEWDEMGILEKSSQRKVTSPLKKSWAA